MANVTADSYNVAAGVRAVRMGRGSSIPALQLSGVAWTPNRDSAGTVLPTDFAALPPNSWVSVVGVANTINAIRPSAAYPSQGGGDGFTRILSAWGGGAWDGAGNRMFISGGGHSDSSAAETGIYELDAATMRMSVAVARQPLASALTPVPSGSMNVPLVAGEPFYGGINYPLSTGMPGSNHTYSGLLHIPSATMAALGLGSPLKGGLYYPGTARAVINLDTGACSKLWWGASPDNSYITAVRWGTKIIRPYQAWYWGRWDMAQTESTLWASSGFDPDPAIPSFGKDLPVCNSGSNFVPGSRAFVDLPELGEAISFAGSSHQRMRYGAAQDSGATTWTSHQSSVTLTGADAAAMNTASNYTDSGGTNVLCGAGASYLHATGDIYVCPNVVGSEVYRISGLASGDTGTVTKLTGSGVLTTATSGTFGRFRVFQRAGQTLAVRVSNVGNPIEVMRIA